jgi:Ca2+-binding RTX toxin-like protein
MQDTSSGLLIQLFPGREGIVLQGHSLEDVKSSWFDFDTSTASTTVNGTGASDVLFGGPGDDRVYGWNYDDELFGGQGNDTIDGGLGYDLLTGGPGRDVFRYVQGENDRGWDSDTITDFRHGDRIGFAGIYASTLAQLAPYIHQSGADVLIEFGHNSGVEDIVIQNRNIADVTGKWFALAHTTEGYLNEGYDGPEVLFGAGGNDSIFGEGGADSIDAGAGDDHIIGGAGVDHLIGGKGADTFFYRDGDLLGPATREVIADFSERQHDRIDISAMDADTTTAGNQAFTLIDGAFTAAGQISITEQAAGDWLVAFNTDADAKAEYVLEVMSATKPVAADFVL